MATDIAWIGPHTLTQYNRGSRLLGLQITHNNSGYIAVGSAKRAEELAEAILAWVRSVRMQEAEDLKL